MNRHFGYLAFLALVFSVMTQVDAGVIVSTLGNKTPGFNDGDIVSAVDVANAQSGSPAPFDGAYGNELFGPNFSNSWTHNYASIADIITSVSLTIGIHDSEGGSVGVATDGSGKVVTLADEQLDVYDVDGVSAKSLLLPDFEAGGQGLNGQYEVYSITLPSTFYAAIADGSATIDLGLKGPVFSPRALPFLDDVVNDFNGASLVFSELVINFQQVPEPGSAAIWSILGIAGLANSARRKSGNRNR